MKRTTLMLALLAIANASIAQKPSLSTHRSAQSQMRTTGTGHRVIGISKYYAYNNILSINDSLFYVYSGSRGSVFNMDKLTFNDEGENADVQFDSTASYTMGFGPAMWVQNGRSSVWNNTRLQMQTRYIALINPNDLYVQIRNQYHYNTAGSITGVEGDGWDPQSLSWKGMYRSARVYNTAGRLIADTQYANQNGWHPTNLTTYTYDANGNRVERLEASNGPGGWSVERRYTYDYNAACKMTKMLLQYFNINNWENGNLDSFSYDASGRNIYFSQAYSSGNSSWNLMGSSEKHYNSLNQVDSEYINRNIPGQQEYLRVWQYHSHGNPADATGYEVTNGTIAAQPYSKEVFYYEQYETATSVPSIAAELPFTLSPNPATTILRLHSTEIATGSALISIIDAAGQQVLQGSYPITAGEATIPIGNLAPGTYFLKAGNIGMPGNASWQFVKQ